MLERDFELEQSSGESIFEDIASSDKEAVLFGFQWENPAQIMTEIRSECLEIEEHLQESDQREALQDEVGDLLHAVFSLCGYCQFDSEQTLRKSLNKFQQRLEEVKCIAREQGLDNLQGKSSDELMQYWESAKKSLQDGG